MTAPIFHRTARIATAASLLAMATVSPLSSAGWVSPNSPEGRNGIAQALLDLQEKADKIKITAEDYENTSLKQIVTFGTPAGFRIKIRYLDFGVALVEAFKIVQDKDLRKRLIDFVQWSRDPKVRAEALVTLASKGEPSDKRYFKEAILDSKVGIRFAAVEAIQTWRQPEALPLLKMSMSRDWSPLMQVWASQALLSLGEPAAISTLWTGLDNNSWVVRAMSARYLGDYAKPDDYEKIMRYLSAETRNDFVKAELCVAALKLISKKGEKVSYSPASPGWKENEEVKFTVAKDQSIELEPLIIVPPQLRIPPSLQAAARANTVLLQLMRDRLDSELPPEQAQDPVVAELNQMVTPTGFAIKMRYSQLSYLLVEGLGGTGDPVLQAEIRRMATVEERNGLLRATALLAIAYRRDPNDAYLFQDALNSRNATVRMGALEGIEIGRFKSLLSSVSSLSGSDPSPAIQIYALQVMAKFGNPSARQVLISRINDPDWPARAMAYWTLGRYGSPEDYGIILARLNTEQNPFVRAEIALASVRLAPVQ